MATTIHPYTFRHGFKQASDTKPWVINRENPNEEHPHYTVPPSVELLTSTAHNDQGINVLRTWPTLYDGTASPHGTPEWWTPKDEVDVLICGGE
jgi:phenol 2-monooxygenase (NADPH)